ncbi:hypothetical protein C6401_15155 [Arthrobacter woluwensis]|uniref:hypothetical protein n=1 Tax=Arthrobacter woluwensis TaxID=156980 RepID=UPI000D136373|nr:hypothetical protein [Arthrobacter woluwensis]PSS42895.1 hypothetical protein C6401_15155 [Arthrobacter woluwensis]
MPSKRWIDRDLELIDGEVTTAVNGAAVIRGRLPLGNTTGAALKEWGHFLIAEQGEGRPIVGIVDTLTVGEEGQWLHIEAGGFSQYPTGMPWVDLPYSGIQVDPMDIVRMIWAKLQNKPDGNLGVVLDGTKSPARLGTPEAPARTAAKAEVAAATTAAKDAKNVAVAAAKAQEAARVAVMTACGKTAAGFLAHQDTAPGGDRRSTKNVWIDKNNANKGYIWNGKKWVLQNTSTAAVVASRVATWVASKTTTTNAKKASTARAKELTAAKKKLSDVKGGEADPWTMAWWDTHDLGQVISTLADDTPFEWRESASWSGDNLSLRLELGYPTLGARRPDLRFEIGINVVAVPPLDAKDYASEVTVLGAGEGRAMRRAIATGNKGRIRRAVVVQRKEIRKNDAAGAAARAEVAKRAAAWVTDTLKVIDHSNAPYGSFQPGDRIYLTGNAGWADLNTWVRINEMAVSCTTGAITLKVEAG